MPQVGIAVSTPPVLIRSERQRRIYELLHTLQVDYLRVDTEEVKTMEDCQLVDQALGGRTVKTIFLCNRQQTAFYLFVTPGDKPFVTRNFSGSLGVSRVSFAPAELLLEMLETESGGTSVFSLLSDTEQRVRLIIDSDVLDSPTFTCTDGTYSSYMLFSTAALMEKILPAMGRTPEIVRVEAPA